MAADWLAPTSLEEALALRAEHGDEATVVAGGTFLAILLNQRLIAPSKLLALRQRPGTRRDPGERRAPPRSARHAQHGRALRGRARALARARHTCSPSSRARASATRRRSAGCSATPTTHRIHQPCSSRSAARVVLQSARGARELPVEELIVGHYETSLEADELITEVVVPGGADRAVYRKFRSRSHEDRPCVGVAAAATADGLRVVVGAVAGTPQFFPERLQARRPGRRSGTPTPRRSSRSPTCAAPPTTDAASSPSRCGGRSRRSHGCRMTRSIVTRHECATPSMSSCPGCCTPASFGRRTRTRESSRVDTSAVPADVVVLTPDDVRDLRPYGCQIARRVASLRSTSRGTSAILSRPLPLRPLRRRRTRSS